MIKLIVKDANVFDGIKQLVHKQLPRSFLLALTLLKIRLLLDYSGYRNSFMLKDKVPAEVLIMIQQSFKISQVELEDGQINKRIILLEEQVGVLLPHVTIKCGRFVDMISGLQPFGDLHEWEEEQEKIWEYTHIWEVVGVWILIWEMGSVVAMSMSNVATSQ